MAIRFLHAADIHLGFQQYGSQERFDDFFYAFEQVIAYAIDQRVDFVLLAGDLFHKRVLDPTTLFRATQSLIKLRNAGIRAIAVQGNHERPDTRQTSSWLDFMAHLALLVLLSAEYAQGQLDLAPWDDQLHEGAYVDVSAEVRVIGVQYVGASIKHVLRDVAARLDEGQPARAPYTIGVLHAGLQGILEHYGGSLSRGDLECLRPHCDYLALGHIHKPYVQDDWVYNPGSLESNSIDEWQWHERGFFDVSAEPRRVEGETRWVHEVKHLPVKRRRFERLVLQVSGHKTPDTLAQALEALLAQGSDQGDRPVVELRLSGILEFDHALLDVDAFQQRVEAVYQPLICQLKDNTSPSEYEVQYDGQLPREELERSVLQELVARDASRRESADAWAELILSIKRLALAGTDAQAVVDTIAIFAQEHPMAIGMASDQGADEEDEVD